MDAVLFPLQPGRKDHPMVRRLYADGDVTALQVSGDGIDDTYILCEEGTGPVTIGDVTFEGRALLLRMPALEARGVRVRSVIVGERPITLTTSSE